MDLQEVKRNLNKRVKYKGFDGEYKLTACILRRDKTHYFYQAELLDLRNGRSVIYCKLSDIEAEVIA